MVRPMAIQKYPYCGMAIQKTPMAIQKYPHLSGMAIQEAILVNGPLSN